MSRNEQAGCFDALYNHCYYYENIQCLENTEEKLRQKLSTCGVSDEEFDIIDGKIDESTLSELEEVKSKILRVQQIKLDLQKLTKTDSANKIGSV